MDTNTFELIINVLFILCGMALGALPLAWDIKVPAPIRIQPDRKIYTKAGKVFIGIVIVTIILGTYKYILDSRSTNKLQDNVRALLVAHATDSMQRISDRKDQQIQELTKKKQVSEVKSVVDSVNGKLTSRTFQFDILSLKLQIAEKQNLDLQKEFNNPILTEIVPSDDSIMPHIKRDPRQGLFTSWISYKNSGKGVAKNIRPISFILTIKNDKEITVSDLGMGDYSNKRNVLENGEVGSYIRFFHCNGPNKTILCLEIKYQNSLLKEMPPYRAIYYYDSNYVDKKVPIIPNDKRELIESYLISNKYWE